MRISAVSAPAAASRCPAASTSPPGAEKETSTRQRDMASPWSSSVTALQKARAAFLLCLPSSAASAAATPALSATAFATSSRRPSAPVSPASSDFMDSRRASAASRLPPCLRASDRRAATRSSTSARRSGSPSIEPAYRERDAPRLLDLRGGRTEQGERLVEPWVEDRGVLQRSKRLPDSLRGAAVLAVGERLGSPGRLGEASRPRQHLSLLLEPDVLAGQRIDRLELLELEGEVVGPADPLPLVVGEGLLLAHQRRERLERLPVAVAEATGRRGAGEGVEEVEVGPGVEQRDVLVLAGHVDDPAQRRLEDGHRAERAVHEDPSPARARHHPAHQQLRHSVVRRISRRDARRLQPEERRVVGGELEEGLDGGLVGPLPEEVGAHAAAEHQVERPDEQGLAGAGLPGEHVEAGAEADLDLIHHRETRDAQGRQHVRSLPPHPDTAQAFRYRSVQCRIRVPHRPGAGYAPPVTLRRLAGRLLLVVLLTAFAEPARAELYAAISGGAYLPSGTSSFGSVPGAPVGVPRGGLGLGLLRRVGLGRAGDHPGRERVLQMNSFPVMARVRGRLPLGLAVPFVFGGVGFAPTRAGVNLVFSNTVAFTAQAGAGVDLVFGDMFTIGAEAGYLWLAPSYGFGTVDLNGTLVLATFALRFG